MSWFKRNLYFLIGCVVALALLVVSGLYFYSRLKLNEGNLAKLNAGYAELKRLSDLNPGIGDINTPAGKTDNIQIAKEQQQQLQAMIRKAQPHFARIPAIPDSGRITDEELRHALDQTIDQLQKEAAAASVNIPAKYNFTFEAEKTLVRFAPGSLQPLATQLGEIKAICGVLFRAKVNRLGSPALQRVRVSDDDLNGPGSDYLSEQSVTNDLAVLTPYKVTFQCFSTELAGVLAGFASAPYEIAVKNISVRPASSTGTTLAPAFEQPFVPRYVPPTPSSAGIDEEFIRVFISNYGRPPTAKEIAENNRQVSIVRTPPPLVPQPQAAPLPVTAAAPAGSVVPAGKGGLPSESKLEITMTLYVVKLLR